ncbi:MAG: hypothetical protein M1604_00025 [Patescibacteria group bacterium]|nr:hypothetical protein [Patescibacteria group bacterium]
MDTILILIMVVAMLLFIRAVFRWRAQMFAKQAGRVFDRQKSKLTEDKVIDRWSALIEGARGQGEKIVENVRRAVEAEKLPGVAVSMREVETENGEKRPFLSLANGRLKGYEMLVSASDYGNRLDVGWYLVFDSPWALLKRRRAAEQPKNPEKSPSISDSLISLAGPGVKIAQAVGRAGAASAAKDRKADEEAAFAMASEGQGYRDPEMLTIAEKRELQNYVGIVHGILKSEVKAAMDELKLDFSKVDTKSQGFLNVD